MVDLFLDNPFQQRSMGKNIDRYFKTLYRRTSKSDFICRKSHERNTKLSLIQLNKEEASFKTENVKSAIENSKKVLDFNKGGFLGAPKFPMPNTLDYLLRYNYQFEDPEIKPHVKIRLPNGLGGIYDQIGGGFSRYSVDDNWHVPHFEKMLYDNAQLVSLYSKAYLQDPNELYKTLYWRPSTLSIESTSAMLAHFILQWTPIAKTQQKN